MSFPNIPDEICPHIIIPRDKVINMLLASIAFEELGLAHVINAGAEEIQSVLGTLDGQHIKELSIDELEIIDKAVEQMLWDVIIQEILLQFRLKNILGMEVANPVSANWIYVSNLVDNNVSVIDGNTNKVIETITVGEQPLGIDVNPKTNRIYVASLNDVSVIDGENNIVIATVPVGTGPRRMSVNPLKNRIYVANFFSNDVSVIDGNINTVIATVTVGLLPVGVGVNP